MQPELHGMVPVEAGRFTGLQQSATYWPDSLKQAAAVCTSLTLVSKFKVVGDVADKQAHKAVEARFLVRPCPSSPCFRFFCCSLKVAVSLQTQHSRRLKVASPT